MTRGPRTATSRESVSRDVRSLHNWGEAHGPHWTWLFFAGPIIWIVYFRVSILATAVGCAPNLLSVGVWSLVGVVGAAVLTIGLYSRGTGNWVLTSRATQQALIIGTALLTATVVIGLPLVLSRPC